MDIPKSATIPDAKLTNYLLIPKPKDDKSKFLAQAGFTQKNPSALRFAIQELIATHEAIQGRTNDYGTYYEVIGPLVGSDNRRLLVVTIWLQQAYDGQFRFVTLTPYRESKS
ncbi:MAG: DUF6883 domain-containing protein [Cyanobacteria bacterium J06621_3]